MDNIFIDNIKNNCQTKYFNIIENCIKKEELGFISDICNIDILYYCLDIINNINDIPNIDINKIINIINKI